MPNRLDAPPCPTSRRIACLLACACAMLTASLAQAADTPPDPPRPAAAPAAAGATPAATNADRLAGARVHIAAGQWRAAINELQRVNEPGSADWHNLMGYAQRKAPQPDLAAAERHYNEALRLDPAHRGALEYSGELYLMTNQPERAERRLAALAEVCKTPCEELADLRAAIDRFKRNGNRWQP